jgi:hypothetical protein
MTEEEMYESWEEEEMKDQDHKGGIEITVNSWEEIILPNFSTIQP